MWKVPFFRHSISDIEIDAVVEVLKSPFITTGEQVLRFEQSLAGYTNLPYIVGVTSGTAALHLALQASGVGLGDEVITTPLSFIASTSCILHCGAQPVFVDVNPENGLMDINRIEAAITTKTKAILPVHLYGMMVDMPELRRIANHHNLAIIEDAAHCLEGNINGIHPGQLGDAVAFSFYATKSITSAEGGAIGVNNQRLAQRLKQLRLHGLTSNPLQRKNTLPQYDVEEIGWKYNMANLEAALLLTQIENIETNRLKRQTLCEYYDKQLLQLDEIKRPRAIKGTKDAYHLYTIWIEKGNRNQVYTAMREQGIEVSVHFTPIHLLSYFKSRCGYKLGDFPVAEEIAQKTISLPLYPSMTTKQCDIVISTLTNILQA